MIRSLFTLIFLSLAATAEPNPATPSAPPTPPEQVSQMTHKYHQVLVQCGHKIWPGYSWADKGVALIYPSQENSWIWKGEDNSLEPIATKKLPSHVISNTYQLLVFGGKPMMTLNMESKDQHDMWALGAHEYFHPSVQDPWPKSEDGRRGLTYPSPIVPRIHRAYLLRLLLENLKTGDVKHLEAAKVHYERWLKSSPKEAALGLDRDEGTAEYAQLMSSALVVTGCEPTPEELRAELVKQVEINSKVWEMKEHTHLETESYAIGGLAALILRLRGENLLDWTERMAKGDSPVAVLLENVTAAKTVEVDSQLESLVTENVARMNERTGKALNKDIARWTDPDYVRMSTALILTDGSYNADIIAIATEIDQNMIVLRQPLNFATPDGSMKYSLGAGGIFFDTLNDNVCPDQAEFTLVKKSDLKIEGKSVRIDAPLLKGFAKGHLKKDASGAEYFCLE